MAFFLERIVRWTSSEKLNISGSTIYLDCIISSLNDISGNFNGHSYTRLFEIGIGLLFDNYLNIFQRSTVIQLNKGYAFRVSGSTNPAADSYILSDELFL